MPADGIMPTEKPFPTSGEHPVRSTINAVNMIFQGKISIEKYTNPQWEMIKRLLVITRERKTKKISECLDIDATAFLTEEEFNTFIEEAKLLK